MTERTVLCVDDEVNVLRALKRLLRKEPFHLLTANSGDEALEILKTEKVHLICSDYLMPGMTGTELLSKVGSLYPKTVRVVLSGYADIAAIVEAINDGHIYRFLSKPWNDDQLKANLKSCLDHQSLLESHHDLNEELIQRNSELRSLSERQQSLIQERTRSLQLAQEVVQALPLPVLGVSPNGVVALSNEEANRLLQSPIGVDIKEVFSDDLAAAIMRTLHGASGRSELSKVKIDQRPFCATSIPLEADGVRRGSLVLLEESPCMA
ncbi:MAG: response regulator [Planctomycetaceae bacterium]